MEAARAPPAGRPMCGLALSDSPRRRIRAAVPATSGPARSILDSRCIIAADDQALARARRRRPGRLRGIAFSRLQEATGGLLFKSRPNPLTDMKPTRDRPALAGLRTLVVDDDTEWQELLALILRGHGADVRTAATAREGLDLLRTWRPDLLVSDIQMPGEDGYAFIAQVRALGDPAAATPAIAVSAYAYTDDRQRAANSGFNLIMMKPVNPLRLIAVARTLASNWR